MSKNYLNCPQKREVEDILLSFFKLDNVVALPGPNINEFIENLVSRGFKSIKLYEYKRLEMQKQLLDLKPKNLKKVKSFTLSPFLNAPIEKNTLYLADYCGKISSFKKDIIKFDKNIIYTFTRSRTKGSNGNDEFVMLEYLKIRNENIISKQKLEIGRHNYLHYTTNKGKYIFVCYKDTSPMCCIAKIK